MLTSPNAAINTQHGLARNSIAKHGRELPAPDDAPLVIDIDSPRQPFDTGWTSADSRIAGRYFRFSQSKYCFLSFSTMSAFSFSVSLSIRKIFFT